ncbi:MAG: Glu/Leu/Phe/Val dehydrogenase dimerization domain-containing protein [Chlamydiota bacterium]
MSTRTETPQVKVVPKAKHSVSFKQIVVPGYEEVLHVQDPSTKLSAIISIHNTTLGPALGGTRIHPYATFEEALQDVLNLSRGMTYKSAMSDSEFGGGKSVIIANPKTEKTPELLTSFAHAVNELKGKYICAEDVGSTLEDMLHIRKTTPYVTGLPGANGSGDPSPFTAWGTFRGIQSVLQKKFGSPSVLKRKIAVQGLGHVGQELLRFLFWEGADLIVTDIDSLKIQKAEKLYGCKGVKPEDIFSIECDVFAPCAMGGAINEKTLPLLRCKAIAGCANNQIQKEEIAVKLFEKGILYAPDFVINAGGLINVIGELSKNGYHPSAPKEKTHKIFDTLMSIYEISEKNQISTQKAAISLADYRLKYGIGKRTEPLYFH